MRAGIKRRWGWVMVWRVVHSLTTNPEVRVISSGGEAERDSGGERNADGELWEGGLAAPGGKRGGSRARGGRAQPV